MNLTEILASGGESYIEVVLTGTFVLAVVILVVLLTRPSKNGS